SCMIYAHFILIYINLLDLHSFPTRRSSDLGKKGIGKAVAERFAAAGDQVQALGHDELDVTDEGRVTEFFDRLGRIDVLVNNAGRSEEHTSELQSRFDLVCRLLLEKIKDIIF